MSTRFVQWFAVICLLVFLPLTLLMLDKALRENMSLRASLPMLTVCVTVNLIALRLLRAQRRAARLR